ncbi:MAG: porin [Candidatus Fermentibacteraceae bacterium]
MRLALAAVAVVALVAFAGGEFATGGSDLMKFKGYGMATLNMWGEEDANPAMSFEGYARFQWLPQVNDWINAKVDWDVSTNEGYLELNDAWLNLDLTENFAVMAGQFKRPWGYAYTRSSSSMYFLDRSIITEATAYPGGEGEPMDAFGWFGGYDVGMNVRGDFDVVAIDLAVQNGTGGNADAMDDNLIDKQVTVRAEAMPNEWATIGVAYGMANRETTDMEDTYSAGGIDAYGVVEYPMSETGTLLFTGEYLMLPYLGAEVEGQEAQDGMAYSAMLGGMFEVDLGRITALTPAVRYDQVDPAWYDEMDPEPEDNFGAIDFCLNVHTGPMNTLQLGARNYTFENEDADGWTDIYANWRMTF